MLKKKYFKTKDECEVTFEYATDSAEAVLLVSEANDWQPVEMKKRKKDGIYYAKMRLDKGGQYQYLYLVDGQNWITDSSADAYVPNEYGGQNGVVDTTPSAS